MTDTRSSKKRRFEGKVAIVTGSTSGVGLCVAKCLAEGGAKVMISSRKQENVDQALKTLRKQPGNLSVAGMVCDVTVHEHRKALIETTLKTFKKLDILVCCAANNPLFGPLLAVTEREWEEMLRVNVISGVMMMKEVKPHMEDNGAVVFLSFIGSYGVVPSTGAFSVSKTALLGLIKSAAPEMLPIRVNCVACGFMDTSTSGKIVGGISAIQEEILADSPLKRIGKPEECAGAVAFLCSSDAGYITGETIVVAGGQQSRL